MAIVTYKQLRDRRPPPTESGSTCLRWLVEDMMTTLIVPDYQRGHVWTPGQWCVLDNDVREDHDSQFRRHVVTPKDGVTTEEADRVIRILTGILAGGGRVSS